MRLTRFNHSAPSRNSIQGILSFLSSYQVTQIDSQTLILTGKQLPGKRCDQQQYLVKDITVENDTELTGIEQTLKAHLEFPQQYFMLLLDYDIIREQVVPKMARRNFQFDEDHAKGYEILTIRAVYQYSSLNLEQDLVRRIEAKEHYLEDQLWIILTSLIQALAYLEKQGIVYGVLGLERMLVNTLPQQQNHKESLQSNEQYQHQRYLDDLKRKCIRLLDPSAAAMDPFHMAPNRLYSPQIKDYCAQKQLLQSESQENILNCQSISSDIDLFKSDVYVLGLYMVQFGLLLDLTKQAHYENFTMNTMNGELQDNYDSKSIIKNIAASSVEEQITEEDQESESSSNDSFNPNGHVTRGQRRSRQCEEFIGNIEELSSKNVVKTLSHFQIDAKSKMVNNEERETQTTVSLLEEMSKYYSQDLTLILSSMVSLSSQERPNFTELYEHLIGLSSTRNIPGIRAVLDRQAKVSAIPVQLPVQPLPSDEQNEADQITDMDFNNEQQLPDWNDEDESFYKAESGQKINAKHSLDEKCNRKITDFERAKQNFLGTKKENKPNNRQCYNEESSSDYYGYPTDESSYSQSSFNKKCDCVCQNNSKPKISYKRQRSNCRIQNRCMQCDHKQRSLSRKCSAQQIHELKFSRKVYKKKGQNEPHKRSDNKKPVGNQGSFKDLLASDNRSKISSENQYPDSYSNIFQELHSGDQIPKLSIKRVYVNRKESNRNSSEIEQGLRQTKQFKPPQDMEHGSQNFPEINQETKSKNRTKTLKDRVINAVSIGRQIFEVKSQQVSEKKTIKQQACQPNHQIYGIMPPRQLDRIQSMNSQQSESTDKYAGFRILHQNNSSHGFNKQPSFSSNPQSFKEATYTLNQKSNSTAHGFRNMANHVEQRFIRSKNVNGNQNNTNNNNNKYSSSNNENDKQIFTDPRLMRIIKEEIGNRPQTSFLRLNTFGSQDSAKDMVRSQQSMLMNSREKQNSRYIVNQNY